MSGLQQPLTFLRGTALMINIVIGAGLLVLPGLAVKQAGDFAFVAWLVCSLLALPILTVFIILGRKFPNAGGIAHFAQTAFGRHAYAATSLVFLGAVAFGLPSIALTGGLYAALVVGGSPHLIALVLLLAATLVHIFSSDLVARANMFLAGAILVFLITLVAVGFGSLDTSLGVDRIRILPSLNEVPLIFAPFMMIFFAFTGWEVAAGLSEEFQNSRRDFPRAMIASFLITTALYLLVAYVVQRQSLSADYEVAFTQIVANSLGALGKTATSIVATVIIFANLSGAIWAVSRLVFSLSRESFLPTVLQKTKGGTPWLAVVATASTLAIVLAFDGAGWLGLDKMLNLAGQNFLVLYGIAAAVLFTQSIVAAERALAAAVVLIISGLVMMQGLIALYPAVLFGIGWLLTGLKKQPVIVSTKGAAARSAVQIPNSPL